MIQNLKLYKNFSLKDLNQNFADLIKPRIPLNDAALSKVIDTISPADHPIENSLVFISDTSALEQLNFKLFSSSPQNTTPKAHLLPKAAVVPLNTSEHLLADLSKHSVMIFESSNPKLAMALISQKFLIQNRIDSHFDFSTSEIHPSAVIHPSAKIGKSVQIGPFSVVGKNSILGDFTKIASHVVIEHDVEIGAYSQCFSHSTISWGTILGEHCVIQSNSCIGSDGFGYATDSKGQHYSVPHVGAVRLGRHVHIGAGTQIDRGTYGETFIDDYTKIDNLVHIAHNCKIGKSCLITAGFMVAGSTEIGNFFVCGGRTTVTGHIKITDQVQLAGLSCVQKSIPKPGKYGGYPIVPLSEHLKTTATSAKIVEFRKDLNRVMKHLNLD